MAGGGLSEDSSAAGGLARHIPVLLPEMLRALKPKAGGRYIDATFGAGGYARAILEAANCRVLGIDRDPAAIAAGHALQELYPDHLTLAQGRFSQLAQLAEEHGFCPADGVVFDLGVSSMQLDAAGRGFSFQKDGPLDMRMSAEGPSAADVLNTSPERDLAEIIFVLGEERRSRAIAKEIIRARLVKPLERTLQLADIVTRVLGRRRDEAKHPATRTFQALRLYVNDELNELARGLAAGEQILAEGGRLAAVSFHSLEDRIVKQFFVERSGQQARPSRHMPEAGHAAAKPSFRLEQRRPIQPSETELAANPRARSARLRWGERTGAPPLPFDAARALSV